jgi:deoxyribodipyrimidine photo-lyase
MPTFNDARLRPLNDHAANRAGNYVLYWMQMTRRLDRNFALDFAIHRANEWKKPLVVYEALKLNYPWASVRIHQFMLEGMATTARRAKERGIHYWPFVETPDDTGRGLVKKLLANAVCLITDDYPAYIVPAHNRAIGAAADVQAIAVDSNGLIPLRLYGKPVAAAAHLRPRMHKLFAEAWGHRAHAEPEFPKGKVDPPFAVWNVPVDLPTFVNSLPLDATVTPLAIAGGSDAGRKLLADFVSKKLPRYGTERNHPDDPARSSASGLSPWLHFGHVSQQEVAEAVLGKEWTTVEINPKTRNKDDFFCRDAAVNGFLDELITWRDIGHHWHYIRNLECGTRNAESKSWQANGEAPTFNFETMDFSPLTKGTLEAVLPVWALKTLGEHATDRREHLYTLEQFETAATHDPLWNAAQTELLRTGKIHNYLRMLWGKKVLEWSESPETAYRILEHLNNKYAIDGRDPNSYTGILWTFGLFDRPWPPERRVFGSIRFMSSDNTAKKFKLAGYYDYVKRLKGVRESLFE